MLSQRIKAAIAGFFGAPTAIAELRQQNEMLLAHQYDMRERNRHFDAALSNMSHGLCMFDDNLRLVACNQHYRDLFSLPAHVARPGVTLLEMIGHSVSIGRHPGQTAEDVYCERAKIFAEGKAATLLTVVDGKYTIQIVYRPMTGGGWVAVYEDITERVQAELALAEQNSRFDIALNNMYHGLCMFDADKRLIVCNRRYAEMYRLPDELKQPGTHLDDILSYRINTDQGPLDPEAYRKDQLKRLHEGKSISYKLQIVDGRVFQIDSEHMAGGGWVATHQDITEATQAEARINHLARHDALTNLPNRAVFRSNLEDALKRVSRGDAVAVLCLDLDQFKAVNDTLGHPVGDGLLQDVADRLRECVRETDTASRLGGDEFAIILTTNVDPIGVTAVASRVIESLSAPYTIAGNKVIIGTSIGIALAPEDGTSPDALLKNADLALYRAKSDGRGVYRFFESGMDNKAQTRERRNIAAA